MYKEDPLYDSVLRAAMTLFLAGTVFDEILSVTQPVVAVERGGMLSPSSIFLVVIYCLVVLVAGFTLLNMLIGVVNQVVSDVAKHENLLKKAQDIHTNMSSIYEEERSEEDGSHVTRAVHITHITQGGMCVWVAFFRDWIQVWWLLVNQILGGPFSAVSKPIYVTKCLFCSNAFSRY